MVVMIIIKTASTTQYLEERGEEKFILYVTLLILMVITAIAITTAKSPGIAIAIAIAIAVVVVLEVIAAMSSRTTTQ